jgi:hypothetical protein
MRQNASSLDRLQDAESQQIEACSAVHLPLDELQSVDLPFHHAVTPGQLKGRGDCVPISPKVPGKAGERRLQGCFKPPGPSCCIMAARDLEEPASCLSESRDLWRPALKCFQVPVS